MDITDIKKIIKDRRLELGLTMKDVATAVGVSEGTVSRWEAGEIANMKRNRIVALANILQLSPSIIMGWTDNKHSPLVSTTEHAKGVRIPILGKVVAGVPIEAIEEIEGWEEIKPELAATGRFFALRVKGRSMEPQLLEGDVVIIKQVEEVNDGDIAIVLVNGYEATVKKIKIQDTGLTLIGLNVDVYPPHFYCAEEVTNLPVKIIGKVVELRRTLGSSGY